MGYNKQYFASKVMKNSNYKIMKWCLNKKVKLYRKNNNNKHEKQLKITKIPKIKLIKKK